MLQQSIQVSRFGVVLDASLKDNRGENGVKKEKVIHFEGITLQRCSTERLVDKINTERSVC